MATTSRRKATPEITVEPVTNNAFALRVPADLREWLGEHKADTGQSVNSIIVKAIGEYRNRKEAAKARRR